MRHSTHYYVVTWPLSGVQLRTPFLGQLTFPEAFASAGENELWLPPWKWGIFHHKHPPPCWNLQLVPLGPGVQSSGGAVQ